MKKNRESRAEKKDKLAQDHKTSWFFENLLLILTILAVFMGLGLGVALRWAPLDEEALELIAFPGQVLTRLLKMLILPLIISSLISGLSQQNASTSSKMGVIALGYYLSTTLVACVLGITLVLLIHPGDPTTAIERPPDVFGQNTITTRDSILDLLRNLFPENLVQSCFEQVKTVYKPRKKSLGTTPSPTQPPPVFTNSFSVDSNKTFSTWITSTTEPPPKMKRIIEYKAGTNVLGLIAFCICFGICLSSMGNKRARIIIEFFFELNEVVMKLISIIMWYSPIGIMFLICSNLAAIQSPAKLMAQLGWYMLTVLLGLSIHAFVSLPVIYFLFTRKNPFRIVAGVLQAIITALGTSSSAATLPVTFRCLEKNLGIDSRVARFVLPIGATVNMDGTALYEAVAPIFIAQMRDRQLSLYQIIVVSVTATLASVGAAAIPSAGLVTMVIVLTSIDLPTDDIYLIWTVDWLLDRFRTSINVLGDCYGTAIVAHLSTKDLERQDIEFAKVTEKEAEQTIINLQKELSLAPINDLVGPSSQLEAADVVGTTSSVHNRNQHRDMGITGAKGKNTGMRTTSLSSQNVPLTGMAYRRMSVARDNGAIVPMIYRQSDTRVRSESLCVQNSPQNEQTNEDVAMTTSKTLAEWV